MKKLALAAALSAACLAPAAQAGEQQATMTPDVITQDTNAASAPNNGIVIATVLISIIAVLASGGGGGGLSITPE